MGGGPARLCALLAGCSIRSTTTRISIRRTTPPAARLTYEPGPGWSGGATYQGAETRRAGRTWAVSICLAAAARRGPERVYVQDGDDLARTPMGDVPPGRAASVRPLYLVGRYEHADLDEEPPVNVFTVGGVWKPFPFMALKVEYRFADQQAGRGQPRGLLLLLRHVSSEMRAACSVASGRQFLAAWLLLAVPLGAADLRLKLIAHPRHPCRTAHRGRGARDLSQAEGALERRSSDHSINREAEAARVSSFLKAPLWTGQPAFGGVLEPTLLRGWRVSPGDPRIRRGGAAIRRRQ